MNKRAPRRAKRSPTVERNIQIKLYLILRKRGGGGQSRRINSRKTIARYEGGVAQGEFLPPLKIEYCTHSGGIFGQTIVESSGHNLNMREQYGYKHHETFVASLSAL